jgi:hypothetical protein
VRPPSLVLTLTIFLFLDKVDVEVNVEVLTNRTLVSLSTPLIKQITFLNTPFYRYGAFGYCPTEGECVKSTGYSTGPEIREWMTETTALFPVGTSLTPHSE